MLMGLIVHLPLVGGLTSDVVVDAPASMLARVYNAYVVLSAPVVDCYSKTTVDVENCDGSPARVDSSV